MLRLEIFAAVPALPSLKGSHCSPVLCYYNLIWFELDSHSQLVDEYICFVLTFIILFEFLMICQDFRVCFNTQMSSSKISHTIFECCLSHWLAFWSWYLPLLHRLALPPDWQEDHYIHSVRWWGRGVSAESSTYMYTWTWYDQLLHYM